MIKWKKFKVQKLPAQKSPDRFASMEASKVAEKSARVKSQQIKNCWWC